MAKNKKKTISKNYWIVYSSKGKEIKHLSWKEVAKEKTASNFYWDEELPAKRYLRYLECKNNGLIYEMEEEEKNTVVVATRSKKKSKIKSDKNNSKGVDDLMDSMLSTTSTTTGTKTRTRRKKSK